MAEDNGEDFECAQYFADAARCTTASMKTLSILQAADRLQVSIRTIYNWIASGRLQTERTLENRSQRVTVDSLEAATTWRPPTGRRKGAQ